MRLLGCIVACFALSGPAFAQSGDYPKWIAERYCKQQSDVQACRNTLSVDDLHGKADNKARKLDSDGDNEPDQWGHSASFPRLAWCAYIHPGNPGWNYTDQCFFTEHQRFTAFAYETKRVGVKNGSGFVLETIRDHGKPDKHTANGEDARLVTYKGQQCFEVLASKEVLCVVPTGGAKKAGVTGLCYWDRTNGRDQVSDCIETRQCKEIPEAGEVVCEFIYAWKDGITTKVVMAEDWVDAVDGNAAKVGDPRATSDWIDVDRKCVVRADVDDLFCFRAD